MPRSVEDRQSYRSWLGDLAHRFIPAIPGGAAPWRARPLINRPMLGRCQRPSTKKQRSVHRALCGPHYVGNVGKFREIGTRDSRRARKWRQDITGVPTVTVPTPRRTAEQFCWAAGLLTSGFPARCRLPTRDTFPLRSREQWPIAAFVPVTVAGAAPAFHRLPSPTNKRVELFQKKISMSSEGDAESTECLENAAAPDRSEAGTHTSCGLPGRRCATCQSTPEGSTT